MWTRLVLALALGAALIACTPAGGSSPAAPAQPSVAAPTDAAPSESMPMDSAAPSAS
jgi:hypothetical protein